MSDDDFVARLEAELRWLDGAIAACHWEFAALSNLEGRRAALAWVIDLIEEAA